jgi:hypothetical protein
MKLRGALSFFLCVALAPIPVAASFTILPEQPTTRDAVVIAIDEIWRDSCGPINPVVIRERGGVRVHFRDLSGPGCVSATSPWIDRVVVGGLPPGLNAVVVTVNDFNGVRRVWMSTVNVAPSGSPFPPLEVEPLHFPEAPLRNAPVQIRGANFRVALDCPIEQCPVGPRAWVGPEEVRLFAATDVALIGEIPRLQGGSYDLRVERADGRVITIPNGVVVGRGGFDRILVPIAPHQPIDGRLGSRWLTSGWVHNGSHRALDGGDRPFPGGGCIATGCPWPIDARRTRELFLTNRAPGEGGIFYVQHGFEDSLTFNVAVRDLSRSGESAGTTIPAVRARDTFSGPRSLNITGIPVINGARYRLRIYDFDAGDGELVRVRLFGEKRFQDLASLDTVSLWVRTIELKGIESTPSSDDATFYPQIPGYAVVDLDTLPLNFSQHPMLRVEIEDLTGVRFWAFVSVTNNETQQFTIVTP